MLNEKVRLAARVLIGIFGIFLVLRCDIAMLIDVFSGSSVVRSFRVPISHSFFQFSCFCFRFFRARLVLSCKWTVAQPDGSLVTHGGPRPADGGGPGHGGPGLAHAGAAVHRVGGGVVPGGGPGAGGGTRAVGLDGGGAGPHAPERKMCLNFPAR